MTPIVWATSDDGQFDFVSLSAETLEGGLNVMRNAFFKHESVAVACEVDQNPSAAKELEELTCRATRDGVSLAAIDKKTGTVAAAAFNKILIKNNPGDDTYFENYVKNCKYESSKALVQFMIDADATVNLFEHYNVDCIMEVMFLATLPEYRNKGLGKKLFELSVEVCRALLRGETVKVSIDDNVTLPLEPVPKVVSSILTSVVTQKITKNLGFVKLNEISFEKFIYQGHTFGSRIVDTKATTLESLKL